MLSFISFMVVFSLVVIVHELGHFLAARYAGVRVYEFSIGFPFSPRILTLGRHRETAFTLRLLPLGGFVSFAENDDEDSIDLLRASLSHRALIMAAGSLFNLLFAFVLFAAVYAFGKGLPFADALLQGAHTLGQIVSGTGALFGRLFTGQGGVEGLAGPLGIAGMAGDAARQGLPSLLFFAGSLSASLGLMNLLPLPALDGGQLALLALERLRRKPLTLELQSAITVAGFAIFLLLTAFVTYKDILRMMA